MARTVAALYVQTGGCYYGPADVDPWDQARDARLYAGPHPVVAHPPCERWGRYWSGGPSWKGEPKKLGDDAGCFAAALTAVRVWGGVLEHPADSHAWSAFGLLAPPRSGGWIRADAVQGYQGWTCCVEQGHYGHIARKRTWLYACGVDLPELTWGPAPQRLPAYAVERYGYAKARRIGALAAIGGKDKTAKRAATPPEFRDLLLSIARSARRESRDAA